MLQIAPLRVSSLADALSDDGAPVRWRAGRLRCAAWQAALGDAWQVEVDGRVVALGGFVWNDALAAAEAWFMPTRFTLAVLRPALAGVIHVLEAARARYGQLIAAVRQGAGRSERLVEFLGFAPSGLAEGGYRWWRYEP